MSQMPIQLRKAKEEDLGFIYSSWLKSFRKSPFASRIPNDVYFQEHRKIIGSLLNHSQVICAVFEEEPDEVFGWICVQELKRTPVIHYIYVKEKFRGYGIAQRLFSLLPLPETGRFVFTHYGRTHPRFLKEGIYYPYLIFENLRQTELEADEA